ncbi:hypothetical protein C8_66 [Cannes 8 virus]|nr:hypothetical protein C8_66 [Cannes 8 virus]
MERQIAIFSDIAYMQKEIGGPPRTLHMDRKPNREDGGSFWVPLSFWFCESKQPQKILKATRASSHPEVPSFITLEMKRELEKDQKQREMKRLSEKVRKRG